jgi:hypothetical protein
MRTSDILPEAMPCQRHGTRGEAMPKARRRRGKRQRRVARSAKAPRASPARAKTRLTAGAVIALQTGDERSELILAAITEGTRASSASYGTARRTEPGAGRTSTASPFAAAPSRRRSAGERQTALPARLRGCLNDMLARMACIARLRPGNATQMKSR